MVNFLKYKWLYGLISGLVIASGIYSVVNFGFSFSIDFVGGSKLEYQFDRRIEEKLLRQEFQKEKIKIFSFSADKDNKHLIKASVIDDKQEKQLRQKLEAKTRAKIEMLQFETVGPTLGRETQIKTIIAGMVAIVGILIYLSFVFADFKYGAAAILAMIHDFLVMIGSYSLFSHFFGAEVDSLFVTALLTTMSFSVHDTIVVFGKIKEYKLLETKTPFSILVNRAVTKTMVRSLNNSLTIILMLISLILLGGSTTRFFVISLLVGTITGTYSSPFIAVPILEMMERKKK